MIQKHLLQDQNFKKKQKPSLSLITSRAEAPAASACFAFSVKAQFPRIDKAILPSNWNRAKNRVKTEQSYMNLWKRHWLFEKGSHFRLTLEERLEHESKGRTKATGDLTPWPASDGNDSPNWAVKPVKKSLLSTPSTQFKILTCVISRGFQIMRIINSAKKESFFFGYHLELIGTAGRLEGWVFGPRGIVCRRKGEA